MAKQRIALITLGVLDLKRSKYFYMKGFGWEPIMHNTDTALYQMNGFVLSTWLQTALEEDVKRDNLIRGGAVTLAHNVDSSNEVQNTMERLVKYGGRILRLADNPSHGGMRGYVADPDNHIWEIIWNSVWNVEENGLVKYIPA